MTQRHRTSSAPFTRNATTANVGAKARPKTRLRIARPRTRAGIQTRMTLRERVNLADARLAAKHEGHRQPAHLEGHGRAQDAVRRDAVLVTAQAEYREDEEADQVPCIKKDIAGREPFPDARKHSKIVLWLPMSKKHAT